MKPITIALLGSLLLLAPAAFTQTAETQIPRNEINIGYVDPVPMSLTTELV